MADTVELDPGSGGAIVSTDDLGAAGHVQWVKLRDGTDGGTQTIASGGGTEAASLRVTVASDSTGVLSVDDNGASLTVDGTVTANLAAGTNNIGDVDVLSVPADPFGANADAASTAGSTGSVQAKLRLMTSQLDAIKTAVETLDNTVGGSELQVDVVSSASHAVTNAGTFAVQVDGNALTALQLIDNTIFVDDAAFSVGSSSVSAIGLLADQGSTDSVNEGDVGIPRMTLDRKQISTIAPSADTEGLTIFRTLDADVTEEEIKATAGKLYGWYLYNDGAAEAYVKFYNATAANVTVGSTTPILTIPVPAGSAANVEFTNGISFSTALCIAATTVVTDADTTDTAANQVVANVFFA